MRNKEFFAKLKICGSMAIFGSIGVFVKHLTLPAGFLVFLRALVGFLFLLPIAIIKRKDNSFADIKSNFIYLIISGICLGANWVLLFEAYRYINVSIATLCYYLAPVFIVLCSSFVLKERLTLQKCLGVFLAVLGMVFISGVFDGSASISVLGIIFGVCAAVLYASVVLINKKIKNVSVYNRTTFQLGISVMVTLIYSLFTEKVDASLFDTRSIIFILILGIVHTGLAYVLYFSAICDVKAHTAAILSYIDPILSIVFAFFILKEVLLVWEIVGAILVLLGAFVSENKFRYIKERKKEL